MTWTIWLDGNAIVDTWSPTIVVASAVWCLQAEAATPDRALGLARRIAKVNPRAAVLVRCGEQNWWALLRGQTWAVRPSGVLEASW